MAIDPKRLKIGVFDSGIGGLSVANAIKLAHPELTVIFKNDSIHVPYGTKTNDQILAYCLPVLEELAEEGVDCIVIACNTVSTNLMEILRKLLTVPLIPVQPMVEEAAKLTTTGVIAVCATPSTLASPLYQELKQTYARDTTVLEPDCSDWASMIENNSVDQQKIAERITAALTKNADVIVLGCTHYHWIETEIRQLAGTQATVLQPEPTIIAVLEGQLGLAPRS